jgi:hypothetical protein
MVIVPSRRRSGIERCRMVLLLSSAIQMTKPAMSVGHAAGFSRFGVGVTSAVHRRSSATLEYRDFR